MLKIKKTTKTCISTLSLIALLLTGCGKKDTIEIRVPEDNAEPNIIIEEVSSEVIEEPIIEEEKIEKISIKDLFILSVPITNDNLRNKPNPVLYYIVEENINESGKVTFKSPWCEYYNFESLDKSQLFACINEWWIPDYRMFSVTPLIYHPYMSDKYQENESFTKEEIKDLEDLLNSTQVLYYRDHEYLIDKLIMIDDGTNYALYSFERGIRGFETKDGCEAYYLFDVTNYENGLLIYFNVSNSDRNSEVIFGDGDKHNVKSFEITSLDRNYALNFEGKDLNYAIGNLYETVTIEGIGNARICRFSKYLTDEQINRGFLTQDEVEDIVESLNNNAPILSLK